MSARYVEHVASLWATACIVGVVIAGILIFALLENIARLQNFRFTIAVESSGTEEPPQVKKERSNCRRHMQAVGRLFVVRNRDRIP